MSPGRLLGHPSAAPLFRTCSPSWAPLNPLPRPAPTGYLHVFPQRAGVGVRFVTHFAQVGFVRSVDVHVLLPVAAVGKAPVTAFELTLEGLFPCKKEGQETGVNRCKKDRPTETGCIIEGILFQEQKDLWGVSDSRESRIGQAYRKT